MDQGLLHALPAYTFCVLQALGVNTLHQHLHQGECEECHCSPVLRVGTCVGLCFFCRISSEAA
jgi:hypothetical protein